MPPDRHDALVIGGGISGLTIAFRLQEKGRRVMLLEASERLGGVIRTHSEDGWLIELGPNTVLGGKPGLTALIRSCGLEADLLTAPPAAARRWIWKRRRLVPLPGGPVAFAVSSLFSWRAKLRLLREPWVPPAPSDVEESIAEFTRRRLGPEALRYAVGPFVSGVFAGDPERLAVAWAVPRLSALERRWGSLIRGALRGRRRQPQQRALISFRRGLETLPRALADRLQRIHTGARCEQIEVDAEGFRVRAGGHLFQAPQLAMAVPADETARLLETVSRGRSVPLAMVPYAPLTVVALGYRRQDVPHRLNGFGFLVPRQEGVRILGCLFPSSLFPGRAPDGHVLLTAFLGGRADPAAAALDDGEAESLVRSELRETLKVEEPPVHARIARWPRAIPQYEIGHGRFVALAAELERSTPGLFLGGSVLRGVSVPDCIANGIALADRMLVAASPGSGPRD